MRLQSCRDGDALGCIRLYENDKVMHVDVQQNKNNQPVDTEGGGSRNMLENERHGSYTMSKVRINCETKKKEKTQQ